MAGTTTAITWAWGTNTLVQFNPATDILDFGWFSADNFSVSEVNGSVVISIPSNNQTYTLSDVTLAQLSMTNISAKDASAAAEWQTALSASGGGSSSGGTSSGGTSSGGTSPGGSTGSGTGGSSGTDNGHTAVTTINWSWGSHTVLDFHPATDKLDFGWFSADNFSVSEENGSVVISIPSNQQTYTLSGVTLSELTMANISGKDASALAEWQTALSGSSSGGSGTGGTGSGTGTGTGGSTGGGSTGGSTGGGSTGGGSSSGGEAAYADAWSASKVYTSGAHVSVGNAVYEANWWTSGDDPTSHSGASGSGQVWTFVGYMDTTPVTPDAPADLHAVSTAGTSTVLVWDAATVNGVGTISGYNIYEGDTLIATTTNTYYKVSGLNPSSDYKFSVVAVDEAGASQHSNVIDVTTHSGDATGVAKSFSPYVDMSLTTSQNLVQMVSEAGLSAVTLAFVLSSGTDKIGWGGIGTIADDTLSNGTKISTIVDTLHSMGVDVTISFGGANGQEPAATATSAQALAASYQSVIDKYHVTHLDFDIEGAAIANTAENATRNAALAALEKANPDLEVSFTLPVLTTGLTQDGINFLKAAIAAGVHIDTVNIMAMDYGAYYDTGDMGKDAISAATATLAQLHDLGLDTHIVITPMIGINDVTSEVFTLQDAHELVDFVAANDHVDGIAMWSLGRDNGSVVGSVSPTGSGLTQSDFAFSDIFNSVSSGSSSSTTTASTASSATVTVATTAETSSSATSSASTALAMTAASTTATSADATATSAATAAATDTAHHATTTAITWAWGSHQAIDFHPDSDTLDFGWMSADNFKVSEENGSVVIAIPTNDQTYILSGVTLSEMNIDDISAKDASTVAEWKALIDAAHASAVADTTDPLHAHDGTAV